MYQARRPCSAPTPGVHPNPCPLSQWCHPTTSSSVVPLSSRSQSFPASGSFPMSQLFVSGGQSIGVSASTSVLPMNNQGWSPLGWMYDLNQIPYDYTVEMRNRFKGLDLIDWVSDTLWMEVFDIVLDTTTTGDKDQDHPPKKRNSKKQNGYLQRPNK